MKSFEDEYNRISKSEEMKTAIDLLMNGNIETKQEMIQYIAREYYSLGVTNAISEVSDKLNNLKS